MLNEVKSRNTGKKLEPYPIASALFFILSIFYLVCMILPPKSRR